jgi:hypothetical protein
MLLSPRGGLQARTLCGDCLSIRFAHGCSVEEKKREKLKGTIFLIHHKGFAPGT